MQIDMASGSLTLRFNGVNTGNQMEVTIRGGDGDIRIAIPESISSVVHSAGAGGMIPGDGFSRVTADSGAAYATRSCEESGSPQINIEITSNHSPVYLESLP